MKKMHHLIGVTVVGVSLLGRDSDGITLAEIKRQMDAFNRVQPETHDRVKEWLEGRTLSGASHEAVDEQVVACLWCSLEHFMDMHERLGHVIKDGERYSITKAGRVYFELQRKELEQRRLLLRKLNPV